MRNIVWTLLFILSGLVYAEPNWIYEVDVTDANQQSHAALQSVIDRLTPGPNDHDNPIINQVDPKPFIESVQHNRKNQISIRFNAEKIKNLMKDAGLRPWLNRPNLPTYVLSMNYPLYRCLLPQHDPELFAAIEKSAKSKGMTLTYLCPEGGNITYNVRNPHQRWEPQFIAEQAGLDSPEGILLLRIHRHKTTPNQVLEADRMIYKGNYSNGTTWFDFIPEKAGLPSLIHVSQFLYDSEKRDDPIPVPIDVRIHNVQTGRDFTKVQTYLESIPGVIKLSLNSVTADSVLYTLDSIIPRKLLAMRLSNTYQSMSFKEGENIFNYRLQT